VARGALDGDFKNFRAVTLAVAIGATQVNVTQKLHFHMLKTRAAAGGAAAVTAVEAELAGGVAALSGQRCVGKNLTHGVPRANITRRVRARGFADGGLVHKHHVTQQLRPQQPLERARGLSGLAKVAQQSRGQGVLNQGGFARA